MFEIDRNTVGVCSMARSYTQREGSAARDFGVR
jgi:hypothetical protein